MSPPGVSFDWLVSGAMPLVLIGVLLLAYIKIGVVLEVLRRGLSSVLPAALTALLALLLSVLAMMPLVERCQQAISGVSPTASAETRLEAATAPVRDYLKRHTAPRELTSVQELATRLRAAAPTSTGEPQLPTLLVAFALFELRVAFQIAFVLLLPFLLIDLLCASLLSGLLLPGLSARMVALPFKLLLFVACDGWQLLARGLLSGYGLIVPGLPGGTP